MSSYILNEHAIEMRKIGVEYRFLKYMDARKSTVAKIYDFF